jgi:indolepyruvate ferredoxin oxidoreductase beta subunit
VKLDVVIAGCAGQGVLTMAKILVHAATREGFDAHYAAHSGIAQLDGPVVAHVRVGLPAGPSPKIPRGGADVVIGLDRLEALRLPPYLAADRTAIVSEGGLMPIAARACEGAYPDKMDVEVAFAPQNVLWIPAESIAASIGVPNAAGAVLLGALSGLYPTIERDHLVVALQQQLPALATQETEAFFQGYQFVTGKDA